MKIAFYNKQIEYITTNDGRMREQTFGTLIEDTYNLNIGSSKVLDEYLNMYGNDCMNNALGQTSTDNFNLIKDNSYINNLLAAYRIVISDCLYLDSTEILTSSYTYDKLKSFYRSKGKQKYIDLLSKYNSSYSIAYNWYGSKLLKTYESTNIFSLLFISFTEIADNNITMRKCNNCNKLFTILGKNTIKYCLRSYKDGKSCRDIGATKQYYIEQSNNELHKVYKQGYNIKYYKFKKGLLSRENLDTWIKEAKDKQKQVNNGSLTIDAFEEWVLK